MKRQFIFSSILFAYTLMVSCDSKPRVIDGEPVRSANQTESNDRPASIPSTTQNDNMDGHLVVVNEILDTEKYSYLNVSEDAEKYWIAIPKQEVTVGNTYFYSGGLLKKNFESKEYNRIFETIYLVSDIAPHPSNSTVAEVSTPSPDVAKASAAVNIPPSEGSIRLSELFSNPENYEGKLIRVTGKCVKVNPMIMGRNWIHIQDGSGEGLDLTITSSQLVKVDDEVSFEGTIALNRDFGAGYQYDVIMEQAVLK